MGLLWRCVAMGLVACLAASCTTFDPLDQTGETINRNASEYANDATLLNVIRATQQEPLTFITITGVDGTGSAGGTLGLPTIGLGPTAVTAPRNYLFGSNSVTRTNSNTFHVSVVDDPTSFAALMAPVNPAVIAFLMRQGFEPALLFFLLTEEIRYVQVDAKTGEVTKVTARYTNDPIIHDPPDLDNHWPNDPLGNYKEFISKLASLLVEGLVAQVDATAIPSGKVLPASRLCIDTGARVPHFGQDLVKLQRSNKPNLALCENAPWVEADITATASGGGSGSGPTSLGIARNGTLWATLAPRNQLLRISPGGDVRVVKMPKGLVPPDQAKSPAHMASFDFADPSAVNDPTKRIQIYLRSTFGAYFYIGAYIRSGHPIDNLLPPDGSSKGGIIDPIDRPGADCFAQTNYRGKHYCVPQNAENTKKLFTVLHLLQQLQTAPSNAPTTLTVTPVP